MSQSRAVKYLTVAHAELNCIVNAARIGVPTKGCVMYLASNPAGLHPCAECAKVIIQAGIEKIFTTPWKKTTYKRWATSLQWAEMMFNEAGVLIETLDAK
jgi:dCMP deaminase